MTLQIGWFSSGKDEAARNLLLTVHRDLEKSGAPASIEWIFCHRELGDAPEDDESRERRLFFHLAAELGIPVKTLSHLKFRPDMRKRGLRDSASAADASAELEKWRDLYGEEVMKIMRRNPADIVVMAGYMLIVGNPELEGLNLINIHPALPWGPRGTWQECIHEIIETGAEEHGIMVHLVTRELDRGPVISYCRFPVKGPGWDPLWEKWKKDIGPNSSIRARERHPLFQKIRKTGEVRELPLLSMAIQEIAHGNITIRDKQIFAKGELREEGVDLTETIERAVLTGPPTTQ